MALSHDQKRRLGRLRHDLLDIYRQAGVEKGETDFEREFAERLDEAVEIVARVELTGIFPCLKGVPAPEQAPVDEDDDEDDDAE